MNRAVLLILFVLVLVAPLIIHWQLGREVKTDLAGGMRELIIVTAHQESIRREFADAFNRYHQENFGEPVTITYLTFGGSEMVRMLDEKNKVTPGQYGIDIAWGGGDYLFDVQLKRPGYLAPVHFEKEFLQEVFPDPTLGGLPLYDLDEKGAHWFGTALSSFGIVYNRDLLRHLGVPEPKTWRDLTDPRLAGWIVLADPSRSASARQAYMIIVERAMADASERGESEDSGWADGMGLIRQIAANARMFSDASSVVPIMISQGEAAAGMAIDFYARTQAEAVGRDRMGYVEPENATIINPDPIGMLKGAPDPELAQRFIRFVLSREGQLLWNTKPGAPGGPASNALRRLPIRRDVYADMSNFTDQVNPFQAASSFNKRNDRERTFPFLGELIQASCIDQLDELRLTRKEILQSPLAEELDARLGRFPFDQKEALERMGKFRSRDVSVAEKLRMQRQWSLEFEDEYRRLRQQAREAR